MCGGILSSGDSQWKPRSRLEDFVRQKIESGQYDSVQHVIEAALTEFRNIETRELDARWLRAKLAVGIDEIERGESLPADEAFDQLQQFIERQRRKATA